MTTDFVVAIGRDSIITALKVVGPIMMVGFVVGMVVSFIQAIMQIQEMTISFVPRLLAIGGSMIIFGHWMLGHLMTYTTHLLGNFPSLLGL